MLLNGRLVYNVGLQWKYGTEKGCNDGRSPRGDVKEWKGSNEQWNYTDKGQEPFLIERGSQAQTVHSISINEYHFILPDL